MARYNEERLQKHIFATPSKTERFALMFGLELLRLSGVWLDSLSSPVTGTDTADSEAPNQIEQPDLKLLVEMRQFTAKHNQGAHAEAN